MTAEPSTTQQPAGQTATPDRVLSAGAGMDAVSLRVGDLERMSAYYADALALQPIEERARGREVHRVLGRGETPMVRLIATPELPSSDPRRAGLFHTAFLFEDAASLAGTVYRAVRNPESRFTGSSDHLVSEAFYFTDPEGNGIELYTDRPREAWQYDHGHLQMDTLFLDPSAYLRAHLDETTIDAAPRRAGKVGHVHLQVGDLEAAKRFYLDGIGFELTVTEYPGALFASAGGYHHHVAMNTWNSRGAGPRAASLGLGDVAIAVPGREDLDALIERLRTRGIAHADTGAAVVAHDPWDTKVTIAVADAGAEELLAR